jgi:aldehyde dehydrogenase (NAD+)
MPKKTFDNQKEFRATQRITSAEERIKKLAKIHKWILANRDKIKSAIHKDFNKSFEETDLTEIYPVISEIKDAKKNIDRWIKATQVKRTLTLITHSASIKYEPKGIVLIISPWNYPFQLAVAPVISAIAAGNSVIIKPSEISVNTNKLIEDMMTDLFEPEEVAVVQGDKSIVSELLMLPFDHIFFTGSTEVGKIIAQAASINLTSFTLELGGKSPVIVDETADLSITAEKIIWGKFLNKGQTCIAPDYILVDKKIREKFTDHLVKKIKKFYGNNFNEVKSNTSFSKIINGHHHKRLVKMLNNSISNGSSILFGGKHDQESRFIEPTLILTKCKNCNISEDEIFGPLLPIVEYDKLEEAIDWINDKDPPLAIYIFSKNKDAIHKISSSTQSGGVGINEVVLQFSHQNLPFGGVRNSGIGRSHGFAGFKTFSNERAYLVSGRINFLKMLYPPYTKRKRQIIDFLVKYL